MHAFVLAEFKRTFFAAEWKLKSALTSSEFGN